MSLRLSLWPLSLDQALKAVMDTGPYDADGMIKRAERRGYERGKREAIVAIVNALKSRRHVFPIQPNASRRASRRGARSDGRRS